MKKKLFFAIAMLICTAGVMAQTAEDKAAAKAAKAELKANTKAAETKLAEAMKASTQIGELRTANATEMALGKGANMDKIKQNNAKMLDICKTGIDPLRDALNSPYLSGKKAFDGYVALEDMSSQLLNAELQKFNVNKSPKDVDLPVFSGAVFGITDAYHGEITNGSEKDEGQKVYMSKARTNLVKSLIYYAYLCQFYVMEEDLEGACKAFDAYRSFSTRYPEIADNEEVKNPANPYNQFAFNIFYTAYKKKNLEVMDKYHDEALTFKGENNQRLVMCAKADILKEEGKTDEWIAEEKKIIAMDPKGDVGEGTMQQLMVYYNNQGKEQADAYTKELVEKYPDSKTANYCRGYALYSLNKLSEAIPFYNKAAEIDPNYSDAVYNSGYCLYQIATEKARAVSGKSMKSAAAVTKATNEVKALYKQAQPYFEKLSTMEPDKSDRWGSYLYYIYSNTGQAQKAAQYKKYIEY